MPRFPRSLPLLLPAAGLLGGCSVVGGVFKAGMWAGFLVVLAVVGLLAWLFGRGRH